MISLLVLIALIGLVAYCLIRFIPMPQPLQTLIIVVAALGCLLFALNAFGVRLPSIGVPQVR